MNSRRLVQLHLVRANGVYAVPMMLPEDMQAGLEWIRQPGGQSQARPYWQAVISYAEEKLAAAQARGEA